MPEHGSSGRCDARGRAAWKSRVRRTIRRTFDAGRQCIGLAVGSVSARVAGSANPPLSVGLVPVPVPVRPARTVRRVAAGPSS